MDVLHSVYISEIRIFETNDAGSLYKVSLRDPGNAWYTVWEADPGPRIRQSRIFTPNIEVGETIKNHDEVIKWKPFPRYWPFVWGIYWLPVTSPRKGQWCEALMFSLIYVWTNSWVNNRSVGDLRRHRDHYDVIVMMPLIYYSSTLIYNATCRTKSGCVNDARYILTMGEFTRRQDTYWCTISRQPFTNIVACWLAAVMVDQSDLKEKV